MPLPSPPAPTPFSIALADFDRDGDMDVATANWVSSNVTVLRNLVPAGGPNTPPNAAADTASTPFNTAVVVNVLGNDSAPRRLPGQRP